MIGHNFKWEKSRGKRNFVEERIDRALATDQWSLLLPSAEVQNIPVASSDLSALYLYFSDRPESNRRVFRFENAWKTEPRCREVICENWGSDSYYTVQDRLTRCAKSLLEWGDTVRRKFKGDIARCRSRIWEFSATSDLTSQALVKIKRKNLHRLLR